MRLGGDSIVLPGRFWTAIGGRAISSTRERAGRATRSRAPFRGGAGLRDLLPLPVRGGHRLHERAGARDGSRWRSRMDDRGSRPPDRWAGKTRPDLARRRRTVAVVLDRAPSGPLAL